MQEMKEKWGLALEGGGARGAYQVGAYKALMEKGYRFDVICGTSIGAINGAAFAQGGLAMAEKLWLSLNNSTLFGVDDETFESILKLNLEGHVDKAFDLLKNTLQQKGLPITGIEKVLKDHLSEEAIRSSDIDYGLVTLSLPDMTPHMVFTDDIPQGKLIDYVMASSNHPAFQRHTIDGRAFIDGGTYNNLPIDMLDKRGCTQVVAIRIHGRGIIRKHRTDLPVLTIEPRENLGSVLDFDGKRAGYLMQLGYLDACRVLEGLKGHRYYVRSSGRKLGTFLKLDEVTRLKLKELLKITNERVGDRLLVEDILPRMFKILDIPEGADYEDLYFALLEWGLESSEAERFAIYTEPEFLTFAKDHVGPVKSTPLNRRRQEAVSLLRDALLAEGGR